MAQLTRRAPQSRGKTAETERWGAGRATRVEHHFFSPCGRTWRRPGTSVVSLEPYFHSAYSDTAYVQREKEGWRRETQMSVQWPTTAAWRLSFFTFPASPRLAVYTVGRALPPRTQQHRWWRQATKTDDAGRRRADGRDARHRSPLFSPFHPLPGQLFSCRLFPRLTRAPIATLGTTTEGQHRHNKEIWPPPESQLASLHGPLTPFPGSDCLAKTFVESAITQLTRHKHWYRIKGRATESEKLHSMQAQPVPTLFPPASSSLTAPLQQWYRWNRAAIPHIRKHTLKREKQN